MAISSSRQQLEADLAAVEQLLSRISHLEGRAAKPDETHNPNAAPELVEERQSSSQGAGKSDAAFTKERSAVGARMTVASSSSDVRKRDTEEGSSGGASKRPKLSYNNNDERNNIPEAEMNLDSGGEGVGSMSTLHSSEETSSHRRDEQDQFSSLWGKCLRILDELSAAFPDSWVFGQPVLQLWPNLDNYQKVIKSPMDLGTARSRVESRYYSNPREFAADVRLTFDNAMLYNMKGSVYHKLAKRLQVKFNSSFKPIENLLKTMRPSKTIRPLPAATAVAPPPPPATPPAYHAVKLESPPPPPVVEIPFASSPPRSVKWDPEPVKTPRQQHRHQGNRTKSQKLNPRLGRQTNSAAYGGQRALTLKEKSKLKELVESFPDDRMNKVCQMLREKMPEEYNANEDVELDLDNLDEGTLFDIYRLAMNWQKSKNKVKKLRAMSEQELEAGSQLPGYSSDNVDIDGDLPDSPAVHQPPPQEQQEPSQRKVEAVMEEQQQRPPPQEGDETQRKDEESSSSEGESSDSDSSSSDSDSGSDSSDKESDGENENDTGGDPEKD